MGCGPKVFSRSDYLEEKLKVIAENPKAQRNLTLPNKGYIVDIQNRKIFVDLTAQDGMRRGILLGIYREGEDTELKHPITEEVLATLKNQIGIVRILEVLDKFSIGYLESLVKGEEIRPGDRVSQPQNY